MRETTQTIGITLAKLQLNLCPVSASRGQWQGFCTRSQAWGCRLSQAPPGLAICSMTRLVLCRGEEGPHLSVSQFGILAASCTSQRAMQDRPKVSTPPLAFHLRRQTVFSECACECDQNAFCLRQKIFGSSANECPQYASCFKSLGSPTVVLVGAESLTIQAGPSAFRATR